MSYSTRNLDGIRQGQTPRGPLTEQVSAGVPGYFAAGRQAYHDGLTLEEVKARFAKRGWRQAVKGWQWQQAR